MNLVMSFRNLPVEGVEDLLTRFDQDIGGPEYFDHKPITCPDAVCLEDLAVTLLVNSRAGSKAALGVLKNCHEINLAQLPGVSLEDTSSLQRDQVADMIATIARWTGFGASIASKMLHKKRPRLIPILDNQALFGAYMNELWPKQRAKSDTVKDRDAIRKTLDCVWTDLNRKENQATWEALAEQRPRRTRIQLFDNVWWVFFKDIEKERHKG